ncbi:hypothetical protein EV663_101723 [Rhodovulum bhavnagarense]|uniref:Type III restriction/modification enzyme restriction subunit n=1 Tax=Rhodovulum bhavnagarense TaxID=992286 RepID=A0A4R2RK34_9RHOB|nr:DEAD/DEAH box helicase family protein [Rhodovulum bhavnagarense]TCP63453.1 hypothetical protein EV663_101723 [Rhodovulum bhavnagarense]
MNDQIFHHAYAIQNAITKKTDDFGIQCSTALFQAAQAAFRDVMANVETSIPHLVNSGTGSGKTTFCVALIAASVAALNNYSAAYVVATIDEAQKVFDQLATLLPPDAVTIHSSAHESEDAARQRSPAIHQHIQTRGVSSRADLAQHRVVVCTHELWIKEGEHKADFGVRRFNGAPRSNVFLDEFPDTVATVEAGPADLDELADELHRVAEYHDLATLVRNAATAFRVRCGDGNSRLKTATLLSPDGHSALKRIDLSRLSDARNMATLRRALDVLSATGTGQCFLSRSKAKTAGQADGHMMLVAYDDRFRPHPGLVILDATADFAPQVRAGHDFHRHTGPQVSYRNLSLTHIQQPAEFNNIASRAASAETIRAYVQWIKATVKANSAKDEDILIVVPKKVAAALHTDTPIPGRNVMVATWGMGVGSNAYRECGAVFLFSEFHKPRHSYLAQSLASRGKVATHDDLRQAMGGNTTGPVGAVGKAHRLRQFKQMACRGRIRELDAAGVAKPMRLFTSMDRALFLESYPALFPDAPPPAFIDDADAQNTGPKKLASILARAMQPREPIMLTADSIAASTGIAGKALKRAFQSKQCRPLHGLGWRFVPGEGRKVKPALRFDPVTFQTERFGCVTL